MKKIIAFAGSSSKQSINKQLVEYTTTLLENTAFEVLDLNDYELPLFSVDREEEIGHPENARKFLKKIVASDGIMVSLAEHNGAYTAVFKNLLDWMSRIHGKTFYGKPMLLMATSDGARGGKFVLDMASSRFPRHDANIIATFSLPGFSDNFHDGKIIDKVLAQDLVNAVREFENAL
ncbi:MAG: NAD(P)H-dependent oxidoreductase [Flavobacteriaceae bacterium]